eukprot:Rhum_TRINITY_DN14987_c27_g1::Rhum_TRINITY_DN14987_c27_g1_i1::g.131822::m.131822
MALLALNPSLSQGGGSVFAATSATSPTSPLSSPTSLLAAPPPPPPSRAALYTLCGAMETALSAPLEAAALRSELSRMERKVDFVTTQARLRQAGLEDRNAQLRKEVARLAGEVAAAAGGGGGGNRLRGGGGGGNRQQRTSSAADGGG